MKSLAIGLLLVGLLNSFLWKWVPVSVLSQTWQLSGAVYRAFLLAVIMALAYCINARRSRVLFPVVGGLMAFEAVVGSCNAARMFVAWPLSLGDSCTGWLGPALSMAGAVLGWLLMLTTSKAPDGNR